MAIGDKDYFKQLTLDHTPRGWFPKDGPVINGVAAGVAEPYAFNFQQLSYIVQQTRLATATDEFLDLIADDLFGKMALPRHIGEANDAYRTRIFAELLRPRGTRDAIAQALEDLTGFRPTITEPWRPSDSGCWSELTPEWLAIDPENLPESPGDYPNSGGFFWDAGKGVGSNTMPYQMFVDVTRPLGAALNSQGYGDLDPDFVIGGFEEARIQWAEGVDGAGSSLDRDILRVIEKTRAAGTTVWVNIDTEGSSPTVPNSDPVWLTPAGNLGVWNGTSLLNIPLQATDPEGESLTYTVVDGDLPTGVTLGSDGLLNGTLIDATEDETWTFTVAAIDEEGGSSERTFSISVIHKNKAPVFVTAANLGTAFTSGAAITPIQVSATDPEGHPVTYSVAPGSSLPNGLSMTSGGLITGLVYYPGAYTFTLRASDGIWGGLSDRTFSMTVGQGFAVYVQNTTTTSDGGSRVAAWPAGTVAGDFAIISHSYWASTHASMSGWAEWRFVQGDSNVAVVWAKTLTSADLTTPPTINISAAGTPIHTTVYRGPTNMSLKGFADAQNTVGQTTSSTTVTPLSMTQAYQGMFLFTSDRGTSGSHTVPGVFTKRSEASSTYFRSSVSDKLAAHVAGSIAVTGFDTGYAQAVAAFELHGPLPAAAVQTTASLPAMTSNSTPSGYTAFGTNVSTPWVAFDGNAAGTETGLTDAASWITGRAYPSPKIVGRYGIALKVTSSYFPTSWVFEGSDDGTTWFYLDHQPTQAGWPVAINTLRYFDVAMANWKPFSRHRVRCFGYSGSTPSITEIQFLQQAEDRAPVWVTEMGSLGSFMEQTAVNVQLQADDPDGDTVGYAILGGTLPAGLTLSSSGLISGTIGMVNEAETHNIIIRASGTVLWADRAFSITVESDGISRATLISTSITTPYNNGTYSPPAHQPGDLLVIFWVGNGDWSGGSAYNKITRPNILMSDNSGISNRVLWRVATSTSDAFSYSSASGGYDYMICHVYRGATGLAYRTTGTTRGVTSVVAPGFTPATNSGGMCGFYADAQPGSTPTISGVTTRRGPASNDIYFTVQSFDKLDYAGETVTATNINNGTPEWNRPGHENRIDLFEILK